MNKFYKVQYVIESGTVTRTYLAVTDSLIKFINVLIEKTNENNIQPRIVDVAEIDEELYTILNLCPILI